MAMTPLRRLNLGAWSEVVLGLEHGPMGFERYVVLKRPRSDLARASRSVASSRLHREAIAYSRIGHPSVSRFFDFRTFEGQPTLFLEYVEGIRLEEFLRFHPTGAEPPDNALSSYVALRVFEAIAAAHEAREPSTREFAPVIHRSISPSNVLLTWGADVKLVDFGEARVDARSASWMPAPGPFEFVAPELVRGDLATVRSDIFSACMVVRALLLGSVRGDPRPLAVLRPDLPRTLARVIDIGSDADPDKRALHARAITHILSSAFDVDAGRLALAARLEQFRRRDTTVDDDCPTSIAVTPLVPPPPPRASKRRWFAVALLSFVVASASFMMAWLFAARETTVTPLRMVARDRSPVIESHAILFHAELGARNTSEPTASVGWVVTAEKNRIYRVFVDGQFVGVGGDAIAVPCGPHDVQVGTSGRIRNIHIRCGETVEVTR